MISFVCVLVGSETSVVWNTKEARDTKWCVCMCLGERCAHQDLAKRCSRQGRARIFTNECTSSVCGTIRSICCDRS